MPVISEGPSSCTSHLDFEAEAMRVIVTHGGMAEIDTQIDDHVEAIKVLRHRRNLLAPISRLPQEILAYIFSCLMKDRPFRLKWLSATHTCKLWRQTAFDNPQLWSYINTVSRKDTVETFLKRSKAAALIIRVAGQDSYGGLDVSNYKLVLEHWSRIRNLEVILSSRDPINESWQNLHSALPCAFRMQRLRLSQKKIKSRHGPMLPCYASVDCSNIIQLAPSLTSLSLSGFHFSWSSGTPKNLSELVLRSLGAESKRPSIVDTLNILTLSPTLKLLILNGVGPTDSPMDSLIHVGLPNLQTLELLRIETNICIKLLQSMELPTNVKWDIECINYPILEPKRIYPYFAFSVCDKLSITLGLEKVLIQTYTFGVQSSPETRLALKWGTSDTCSINFPRLFNALFVNINNYTYKDTPRLEIRINDPGIITSKEQWISLLHWLEGLQHLICHFDYYHLDAKAEECLAEALMHTLSSGEVICSELSHLELHSANFSERRGEFKELLIYCLEFREEDKQLEFASFGLFGFLFKTKPGPW